MSLLFRILHSLVLGAYVASSLASAQNIVVPRNLWEIEPDLGSSWELPPVQPNRSIDLSKLSSALLQDRVEEAQHAALVSSFPGGDEKAEALQLVLEYLNDKSLSRRSMLAFIGAVIGLSDGEHAEKLWLIAQADPVCRMVVEQALAEWKSDLALPTWRERLQNGQASNDELIVAIEGIGVTGSSDDCDLLKEILLDRSSRLPIQLAASRALANLANKDLESFAQTLRASEQTHYELLIAHLLRNHSSTESQELHRAIVEGSNQPARVISFATLITTNDPNARKLAEAILKSEDPSDNTLRFMATELLAAIDDMDSLKTLAYAIRDPAPNVRRLARSTVRKRAAADPEKLEFVSKVIEFYLKGDEQYGTEQAIILSVQLELKERSGQMVALLKHPTPRVFVRAGWALQHLATTPSDLLRILEHSKEIALRMNENKKYTRDEVLCAAFLFQTLGRNQYTDADEMLRWYIPKEGQRMNRITRTAAIWALGKIHSGTQNANLAGEFAARLLDADPNDVEENTVRYTSALAMGWIGSPSSVQDLEQGSVFKPTPTGFACDWAIQQISNEQ